MTLPIDAAGFVPVTFHLWDTHGTADQSDDTLLLSQTFVAWDVRAPQNKWFDFYTLPYSSIKNGGQFRVQVVPYNQIDSTMEHQHGENSFAIAAFRSWGAHPGCDTRSSPDCPRVYANSAESVFNNLSPSGGGSTVSFYFAEFPATSAGTSFDGFLWDPAEGVQKIELLAPNGTPLNFTWSCNPDCPALSGAGNSLDTSGTYPPEPNRSNDFKFNDRLVTLHVALPANYPSLVNGSDDWLRIRYTLGSSPSDRTTWGMSVAGGTDSAPKLVPQ